jgi:hypothetical protein
MQEALAGENFSMPKSIVTDRIAAARLIAGLVQGAVLYFLYISVQDKTWPATDGQVFAPLLLISLFVPVILVSGLGHLDAKRVWLWTIAASVIAGALGFYDIWRGGFQDRWYGAENGIRPIIPSPLVFIFTGAGFYIAHALVLAAAADKRRIASYPTYFETAWKLAIQIKFSALFVGVLWLVLWLGASLFMLVKLDFLKDLLRQSWFAIPITAFAFSCAFHITDVRPGIVRGIRTLLLVLMSWLLPITTLIVAGFLLALPWTGLAPLWATRHATAVLLAAAAALVLLINAAFQGGEIGPHLVRVLRLSARAAAVLLLPMISIAVYSLALRVGEYGWTTDRIIAATCLLVASCYACGYLWAAVGRGAWLSRIAPTNVFTALVILAVLLALFSPVADPARLSVADQLARLEAGKATAAKFDFDYLKFHGARYGAQALQGLKARTQGSDAALVRERAEAAIRKQHRWERAEEPAVATANDIAANLTVWPAAGALPKSFLGQNWSAYKEKWALPQCLTLKNKKCDAYLIDFNEDGNAEILLLGTERTGNPPVFMRGPDDTWDIVGTMSGSLATCREFQQALGKGAYRMVSPLVKDLEVAGQRIRVAPRWGAQAKCDTLGK